MKFYIYEWYIIETNQIFYVGKGCKYRYHNRTKRNKIFLYFLNNFQCDSRIIQYFSSEEEAFKFEKEYIFYLKTIGQAKANLDNGGKGGCHFIWTEEMRKYKSIHNPMKDIKQKERMSKQNPMKNKEVSQKVALKLRKKIVLNGIVYEGILEASRLTGRSDSSIIKWCKRGYDDNGNPCRYYNEEQKEIPSIKKTHPKAATPKPIIIDGLRFETVEDGAKYIGVWPESIIRAIKQNRSCKGHICKYANQQPSTNLND